MLVSIIITDEGSHSAAETFDFNPSSTWLVFSSNIGSYTLPPYTKEYKTTTLVPVPLLTPDTE